MNMKKMLSLALAGVMALSLMACSAQNGGDSSENTSSPSSSQSSEETQNNETPESVTITSLNANKEAAELEVPYDPQRIAILDMASLDILNALGVGDRGVGTASTSLEYLQDYINDDIANLGTIKEADLEAVMACEPDVIFIGGRLSSSYDALSEIAPVVYLATDTELGVVESVRQNATTIASMFGLEDKVDELMADFDARITALQAVSEGRCDIGLSSRALRLPSWVCVPAAASMCWATMAAAPLSAWKSALRTSVWTPTSIPPPTVMKLRSSSSWTKTPTTSSLWTGMPPSALTARSWRRILWKMSW